MLAKKQLEEIRTHLEKAQNPVFYYDNDADGLCAFLLLRRFIGRGYGVAIRSYPDLNEQYLRKAEQLKADYIFILDKPVISKEFIAEVDSMQISVVWIDHHDMNASEVPESLSKSNNFYLYNPALNRGKKKSCEPTSYIAYQVSGRKEDLWIALMGCIADHYMPDFSEEFGKRYPEFWGKGVKEPFDVYYKTEIGKIARALNFGLKDSTTHVVKLQNFLIDSKGPGDVFSESKENESFRKKYEEIKKKYDSLIKEAKKQIHGKLLFFVYSGDMSMSSDIANELSYYNKEKVIVVAYKKQGVSNISMRGKNVKEILDKIISVLDGASGGGHEEAVGARIRTEDLEKFKMLAEKEIG